MPIKGLSERKRVVLAGKFKLGEEKVEGQHPKAIDYFRFAPADESLKPAFEEVYGPKPRMLRVWFPTDELIRVWDQNLKCYGKSSGLFCKGDGETATRLRVGEDRKAILDTDGMMIYDEIKCPYKACEFYKKKTCKQIGALQFMLRDFGEMRMWLITTTGENSITNLNSKFAMIQEMTQGRIAYIPLDLSMVKKWIMVPKVGKQLKDVLDLNFAPEFPIQGVIQSKLQQLMEGPAGPGHLALPDAGADEVAEIPDFDDERPEDLYAAGSVDGSGEDIPGDVPSEDEGFDGGFTEPQRTDMP